jgi:hypothetical protein
MSSAGVAVLPALVMVVPVAALVGTGWVVVKGTQLAVEAAHDALVAHQRERVQTQGARRDQLIEQARRLRIDAPPPMPGFGSGSDSIGELKSLADSARAENEKWSPVLAEAQAEFNAIWQRLAQAKGRHEVLSRWAAEAELAERGIGELDAHLGLTASDEARLHDEAYRSSNAALEGRLREVSRCEGEQRLLQMLRTLTPLDTAADHEAALSAVNRWRGPRAASLRRAMADAALEGELPPEVGHAWNLLESLTSVDDRAHLAVVKQTHEAACAKLHEARTKADSARILRDYIAKVLPQGMAIEDYVFEARCERALMTLAARMQADDAKTLGAWASDIQEQLGTHLVESLAGREAAIREIADAQRRECQQEVSERFVSELPHLVGWRAIPVDTLQPESGYLKQWIFRKPGDDKFATQVFLGSDGRISFHTVTLDAALQLSDESEGACAKDVWVVQETLLARIEQITREVLENGGFVVPEQVVEFEHSEEDAVTWLPLDPHVLAQVMSEARMERAGNVPVAHALPNPGRS